MRFAEESVAVVLASEWCQKTFVFFCPIRRQNGGDRLELVWQDIVPRGSSRRSLPFFVPYFPVRLDFLSPPLSAPGSPRMDNCWFVPDVTAAMLVSGHEQKHFSPLRTKLYFQVNSS